MKLHPQLETDTTLVTALNLCQVRLHDNAAFPWILLVPQRDGPVELIDLVAVDQQQLMHEIAQASQVMKELFRPDKLNVASLGNVVPQLHIHIIARYQNDPAWPKTVWNSGITENYDPVMKAERIGQIRSSF